MLFKYSSIYIHNYLGTFIFQCSVNCGHGVTARSVVCGEVTDMDFIKLDNTRCKHMTKPSVRARCREPPCKAQWYTTDWSQVENILRYCFIIFLLGFSPILNK